ncbi:DUF1573 domain-containing protein [Xylanibacter muris]|uniref:DUF1573 domain-containing protein n=1 Tax=Xylanibacter muris TaxID=2736290 RepID=A0ABX2AR75_9BACT|nr:DUF1573 domain-containing protein [Xylanibacter muris]NPD93195.1 DUF1573 domain-containing protein [Xylanibacter muris]
MNDKKKIIFPFVFAALVLPVSAQKIVVEKATADCGNVGYDMPVTAEFRLRNKGTRKLVLTDVRPGCGCTAVEYPKGEIAGGENFIVKLTYDARQLGHFDKSVRIVSNGSKEPLFLNMKGVVVEEVTDYSGSYPFVIGNLSIDKNDIEFDDVNKGDTPHQDIHIVNSGTTMLQPNLMHLPPYLKASVEPQNLRPGRTGKIRITLDTHKLSEYGLTQTSVYLGNKPGDRVSQDNEISVSAVLLPGFDGIGEAQKQYMPQMIMSAETLDIDFDGKSKKSGTIEITNKGRTALKIGSLQMFTGGMKVTLGKRELQPGQSTFLKITVYRDGLKKVRSKPRVLMITNDPDRPKVVININAK